MNNDKLMERAVMTRYATFCGTLMGLFWLAKFTLIPLGIVMPLLMMLFLALTVFVPFIGYAMARNYRNHYRAGVISFGEAWLFLFLTFLYASLLTAMGYYIYFRFIDGGFILNSLEEMVNEFVSSLPQLQREQMSTQMRELINAQRSLTPITIALQQMSQNLMMGAIMALLIAPFVKRTK
ncbi:MAG: DUF4199 domain-containing protein [Bacteroides sp.]